MAKNLIARPILAHLAQILAPKTFSEFYLYLMLKIVASYHCMQFQGKLMIQTQENDDKPYFVPDLGPLDPNSNRKKFFKKIWFRQSLYTMVSYHHVQYQKILMIQSWDLFIFIYSLYLPSITITYAN